MYKIHTEIFNLNFLIPYFIPFPAPRPIENGLKLKRDRNQLNFKGE